MMESRWLKVIVGFAAWTLVGVLFASQTSTSSALVQSPLTWDQAFVATVSAWYVRGALSPVVAMVTRRLPIVRGELARRLTMHAIVALAWAVGATAAIGWIFTAVLSTRVRAPFSVEFATSLLTYAVLVAMTQWTDYHRRYWERELNASRLEAGLATARLDLLRMHLDPHLLLDTLRDVSALMHEDPRRARRLVDDLVGLLGLSIQHVGAADVALSEEVGFLRRYLELERMRFRDRLETHIDVELDALSARLPSRILQPLVESAVRHGLAPSVERGRVEVRGRADGEALVLEVYGDAPAVS